MGKCDFFFVVESHFGKERLMFPTTTVLALFEPSGWPCGSNPFPLMS